MAGMSRRSPWLALGMTIALLSLACVPPAAGFFGKFFLFNAAVQADLTWLALSAFCDPSWPSTTTWSLSR